MSLHSEIKYYFLLHLVLIQTGLIEQLSKYIPVFPDVTFLKVLPILQIVAIFAFSQLV